mgnify:CR=1 FL=1
MGLRLHFFISVLQKHSGIRIIFAYHFVFCYMPDYHLPLLPGEKYHVFSRAVGNEKLFLNANNYSFFLSRYIRHISPVADTYCYCLLPNHFHCMVKIKEQAQLERHFHEVKYDKPLLPELLPEFVMERFSNMPKRMIKCITVRAVCLLTIYGENKSKVISSFGLPCIIFITTRFIMATAPI